MTKQRWWYAYGFKKGPQRRCQVVIVLITSVIIWFLKAQLALAISPDYLPRHHRGGVNWESLALVAGMVIIGSICWVLSHFHRQHPN